MFSNRTLMAAMLPMTLILGTAACHADDGKAAATPPTPATADTAKAVDALKAKTRAQLVQVKGGTFLMGDFGPQHNDEKLPYSGTTDDDVLRKVTLDDYALQSHKVSYADFDVYTDAVGKPRVAQSTLDQPYRTLPDIAAGVSWPQAVAYCEWIGKQIGTPMTLPTEAQWEYAARAGGKLRVYATDTGTLEDGRNVSSIAQYDAFADMHGTRSRTSSLGAFPPNPLGLYDMVDHGYEWVADWYAPEYDPRQTRNPRGPASGTERVQRSSADRAADQLSITSMTFTRNHRVPEPGPMTDGEGNVLEGNPNPNGGNGFRCATAPR